MAKAKAKLGINKALFDVGKGERSAFNECVREALTETALDWKAGTLPRHFEPGAVNRYGYTKRSKSYMLRKARVMRHQKPMVWTGRMSQELLNQAGVIRHQASGGSRRVSLTMWSRAMNFWAGRNRQGHTHRDRKHDFAAELTATTPDELEAMARDSERRTQEKFERRLAAAGEETVSFTA